MIVLARFVFTAALVYGFLQAGANAKAAHQAGDLINAFWLSFCVITGIGAAITWAPLIVGRLIADPLTSPATSGRYIEPRNRLLGLIRWCENRRWRRVVCSLCFVAGVRNPWQAAPFVIGMSSARPGSWLEKVFAEEVYRSDQASECIKAREVLRRHGMEPAPHGLGSVRLILESLDRGVAPEKPPLPAPESETPPLRSSPRLTLFDHDKRAGRTGPESSEPQAKG